ncbi:MAG: Plug domain-containing protein, partial [Gemmatimonadetes bacterium]|nr:Plug domain-containing protein [Gemmatimonadota bacterium]
MPVFNPYRLKLLGGPVSMFNPDMVERVELLPGGFPAQYGDRLAAVLVVENREGARERRRWRGGASLIDMRAFVEGPLPGSRQNGSWIAATRRTYYDQLLNRLDSLPKGTVLPFFRDYQAKLVYDLGPEQKLHLNVLNSHEGALLKDLDVEDEDDEDFFTAADKFQFKSGFDNNLYSLGWANAISDVTLSDLTLSFFNDDWFFDLTTEDEFFRADIDMRKLDIREDLTHIASRNHHLQMGLTVADLITDVTVEIRQDSAAYYEREPSDRRDEDGTMVER